MWGKGGATGRESGERRRKGGGGDAEGRGRGGVGAGGIQGGAAEGEEGVSAACGRGNPRARGVELGQVDLGHLFQSYNPMAVHPPDLGRTIVI